jgi:pyridoxal phosphate enzyme (YggS family)
VELKVAYQAVKDAATRSASGRSFTLIAVSKTQPTEKIRALYELGHRDFGENYVQELIEKAEELKTSSPELRWHFIGHLQSNKVKSLLPWVASVHSVHSLSLAEELSKRWIQLKDQQGKLPVFLEVNIDNEPSKSGLSPAETSKVAVQVARLPGLELRGLMSIPSPEGTRSGSSFRALHELSKSCEDVTEGELSMGMSSDFELALREGATHIRVGTLLFGARTST